MSASSSTLRPVTVPSFVGGEGELLPLVAAVVAEIIDSERVSVYLHGRPSRRATAIVANSSGVVCSLPPKPPPTSGAMTRTFDSGMPVVAAMSEPQDVRHLGGRPHGHLLAGGVDDGRAGLHERRHEPLLAVLALDDDAVDARLGDGLVDVAAGARLGRVELPEGRLVGAEVGVGEHRVGCAPP